MEIEEERRRREEEEERRRREDERKRREEEERRRREEEERKRREEEERRRREEEERKRREEEERKRRARISMSNSSYPHSSQDASDSSSDIEEEATIVRITCDAIHTYWPAENQPLDVDGAPLYSSNGLSRLIQSIHIQQVGLFL